MELAQTVDARFERPQRQVPKVLGGIDRIVGEEEFSVLPTASVRDFDGGGLLREVGEYEKLGVALATGERVDLVVVGEEHVEVAVRNGGVGVALFEQGPGVVAH